MGTEIAERMVDEKRDRKVSLSSKHRSSSFTEQMRLVNALDLSRAEISTLPRSVSEMRHLQALILYGCTRLKTLPPLGNLKKLQLLDLSHTKIEELPQAMEELVSLKRLRLSHTSRLKLFRAGVLQSLSSLEELLMHESRWVWSNSQEEGGAGVDEIARLEMLRSLQAQFKDSHDLISSMSANNRTNLRRFYLSAGFWGAPSTRSDNTVVFNGCDLAHVDPITPVLPDRTLRIVFKNCRLLGIISLINMERLRECSMKSCRQIESLVVGEKGEEPILPVLENVDLCQMPDLRVIYSGFVRQGTFSSLKTLSVRYCHRLESLFSLELLQQLQRLENLTVVDCYRMEEIVSDGEGTDESVGLNCQAISLSRLKVLVMRDLPRLKRVCRRKFVCDSLETIEIEHCGALKKLPFEDDYLPSNLRVIYGSMKWWNRLQWDVSSNASLLFPFLHPLCLEDENMSAEEEDEEGAGSSLEEEMAIEQA